MDMRGLAPTAYRDGLRGLNPRVPSILVPTRAPGLTWYNKKMKIEIVYNNTSKNRLLSLGPPFCYAQLVVGLLCVR
jgi:hypothetical protein